MLKKACNYCKYTSSLDCLCMIEQTGSDSISQNPLQFFLSSVVAGAEGSWGNFFSPKVVFEILDGLLIRRVVARLAILEICILQELTSGRIGGEFI